MRRELGRVAGTAVEVIMSVAERRVGAEEGRVLLAKAEVLGLTSPSALPDFIRIALEEPIWDFGKMRVQELGDGLDSVRVSISNGFEVEAPGTSIRPACFFTSGYFEGLLSQLLGKSFRGWEKFCRSKGDELCIFQLTTNANA